MRRNGRRRTSAITGLVALLVLALAACGEVKEPRGSSQPQGASLRITLGTQEFPEARVLGELWRQVLAVNGYAVDLRKGVGPAEDLDEALKDRTVDGYVAYTGTVLSVVAGQDPSGMDPAETYDAAREFYAGQDMVLSTMTPFENKDAMATTGVVAEREGLDSIEDLADVRGLRLGARPEFEDLELGLAGLRSTYGLDDVEFTPVPLGEQYAALDRGDVDVVDAFTTDPALRDGDYRVLDDPRRLFGSQNVVMVVGEDKLAEIDEDRFMAVVASVNELLEEDVVVDLNAAVERGRSEESVARAFLRENNLLQRYQG